MGFLTRLLAGLTAAAALGAGLTGTANAVDVTGATGNTKSVVKLADDGTSNLPDHLVNGDFEYPVKSDMPVNDGNFWYISQNDGSYFANGTVLGKRYKLPEGFDKAKFAWHSTQTGDTYYPDLERADDVQVDYKADGTNHYSEISAAQSGATIYQDVATVPGVMYKWSLKHASLDSSHLDKMSVIIGEPGKETAQEATRTTQLLADATRKAAETQTAYDQAKSADEQAQASLTTAETDRQTKQTAYDQAKSADEQAQTRLTQAQAALDKANTDVKQAEQDKTAADTRLDVLTDAKNALAKAQTAYDQAKSEADQAQQAKQTAQDELTQAQTAYEQAKKESDKAAQQVKDLENAKTDLAARTQALAAAQADLDAKTQAYDAARNEADKAKQDETDAETAVRNAQQALTDAQARLAKAKSDAKDTEAVKTAQAKVKEAQDALDQAKTILAKAQADLKQAQTVEAQAKSDYETAKAALKTAQQAANPKHDDNAGQTSLNAAQQATVEAAAKADKVMASTGADTNGIILAVVAFAGMGAATLDLKRRRMDVTARHGMR